VVPPIGREEMSKNLRVLTDFSLASLSWVPTARHVPSLREGTPSVREVCSGIQRHKTICLRDSNGCSSVNANREGFEAKAAAIPEVFVTRMTRDRANQPVLGASL
jgi:hypothetical protein